MEKSETIVEYVKTHPNTLESHIHHLRKNDKNELLIHFVREGQLDIIRYLVEHGADIPITHAQDEQYDENFRFAKKIMMLHIINILEDIGNMSHAIEESFNCESKNNMTNTI